jgi:hypothetical protein
MWERISTKYEAELYKNGKIPLKGQQNESYDLLVMFLHAKLSEK